MSTTKHNIEAEYPKRDGIKPGYGERLKYIRYPLRIGKNRWIPAEIQRKEDGTWFLAATSPLQVYMHSSNRADVVRACEIHNNFEFGEGTWEHIVAKALAV